MEDISDRSEIKLSAEETAASLIAFKYGQGGGRNITAYERQVTWQSQRAESRTLHYSRIGGLVTALERLKAAKEEYDQIFTVPGVSKPDFPIGDKNLKIALDLLDEVTPLHAAITNTGG